MKIRMQGNSLRLRLTRSEVAVFAQSGSVQEKVQFAPDSALIYRLEASADTSKAAALLESGQITVSVPWSEARKWASTDRVEMEGQSGPLSLLIEKDFQCIHGEQDPDAFEGLATCPPRVLVPASSSNHE